MEFKSSPPNPDYKYISNTLWGISFHSKHCHSWQENWNLWFFQKQKNTNITIYRMSEHTHILTRLNLRKVWPKPFLWSVLKVSWQGWYQRWPCRGRSLLSPKKFTQLTHLPSFAGLFYQNEYSLPDGQISMYNCGARNQTWYLGTVCYEKTYWLSRSKCPQHAMCPPSQPSQPFILDLERDHIVIFSAE